MRICHVGTGFTSIPPQISAATEEVVYYLSRELISLGCDVSIVDILDKSRLIRGLPIVEVPYFSFIKTTRSNSPGLIAKRLSFSFFSTLWLRRFEDNFDIIHFHNQFPASFFQNFGSPHKNKPKIIYTLHNPIWGLPDSQMPKGVQTKYILEIGAIKKADTIIVVSETLRKRIIKRFNLKSSSVVIIPNGVDTNSFKPSKASPSLRKELAPNGEKIVLCVGRLCRYKGQKTLIESIPKIIYQNPDVKFVFVGPIDDSGYFKEINNTVDLLSLRKHCVFAGTVSSDLLPNYFATADVCVVPSVTEAGPPLTLFQAMSSARAIVASAIPQNMEAAKQGDEIIFVDPLNIEQISDAITELISDENKRQKQGEKARKTAVENFDWKATAKATMRLYENVTRN